MLTAILADDEEIVRSSMAKWIPWKELGIKLAGLAADGEEAYDLIVQLHPDIVITDIKMPKLDGLELIKKVHKKLKDTEFIILSGFSEFEYAQTAMRYGVKHYMLKPALKEELKESLLEVKAEIEERQSTRLSAFFDSKEKYAFYLPFDPDETLTMIASQVLEPDRFISFMLPVIRKLGIRMPIHPVSVSGRVFFVLDISSLSSLETIKDEIQSKRGVLVSISRGTPSDLIMKFVKEASSSSTASIYDDEGKKEAVKVIPGYRDSDGELVKRYRAVLSGSEDSSLIDDIERNFREKELDEAESLFVRMSLRSIDYELLFKELGKVGNMEDLISLARSFVDHKVPGDRDPFPVDTMRRYISENFSNPEISLKWISENVVYMNPEYLSRLFQKEMGQRFTDYLNTTRVNEARKLMSVYHQSTVSEIAEKVGYSNPGYFFHIFRRYTGMTPGEYMDKVRKNPLEEKNEG